MRRRLRCAACNEICTKPLARRTLARVRGSAVGEGLKYSMQVRIIVLDGSDVGWVQTIRKNEELFVAQMFVDGRFQRKGIGTKVMKRLISEATAFNLAVRLNVVRINPARRLYERLGFRVTHEDHRKFYMKRDAGVV
jgi:GNAT superfamily N-acetyltransferase